MSNYHIIVTLCLLRCGVCGGDGLSCGHLARHRASWSLGPLAPCSLTCGGGTQARVTCYVLCVTCQGARVTMIVTIHAGSGASLHPGRHQGEGPLRVLRPGLQTQQLHRHLQQQHLPPQVQVQCSTVQCSTVQYNLNLIFNQSKHT